MYGEIKLMAVITCPKCRLKYKTSLTGEDMSPKGIELNKVKEDKCQVFNRDLIMENL